MTHEQIRKKFLEFFKSKKHTVISSDSLIPAGDPTVLFTSAGMNQFKEQFLGNIKGFTRAASCQKCLRTDDLKNVGVTSYHHTFFEMLGNFSFGDYFKEDAISWAWEFMTDTLKLPEDKLRVSVYEEDKEAYDIWKDKIKIPAQRIVKLSDKENFWPSEAKKKGPNGPCGSCSEIFYDYGEDSGCGKPDCEPGCDCERFVEVWNLVFTQFNRKEGGILEPLPSKNIDTGMGHERLCAVMQGVRNNFETDLFKPIIAAIKTEVANIVDKPLDLEKHKKDIHAIADHIRAVGFAICDGIVPSNEEHGYVIRNLIRKSAMHGRNLGVESPFLYKLLPSVANAMQGPYPELKKRRENISQVVLAEEERFISTLEEGTRILEEEIERLKSKNVSKISGEFAFKLFDTHGLPFDLAKDIAISRGFKIDEKEFKQLMSEQREQSRKTSKMHTAVFVDSGIRDKTEFIGYDKLEAKAKVKRILTVGGEEIDKADEHTDIIRIILDKSVFYGESGGQAGDSWGKIKGKNLEISVSYVRRLQDAILIECVVTKGELHKGDEVETFVDKQLRLNVAKNHTAIHLLQSALRKALGEHVQQQGSFVGHDYLRFDFTHFKALTEEERDRVEELVNQYIKDGYAVETKLMGLEDARESGALAFFGEKYEQKVRVVSCGAHSKELCGGTHVKNTKDIGLFKITREGSVASGIRRIEACTADAAKRWIKENKESLAKEQKALQKKEEEKKLTKQRLKTITADIGPIIERAEDISATKLIITKLEKVDEMALKAVSDAIRNRTKSFVVFLASTAAGKVSILLSISDDLVGKGMHSGKLINIIAKPAGGSGGGKPNMASGGTKKIEALNLLLQEAKATLTQELKKINKQGVKK